MTHFRSLRRRPTSMLLVLIAGLAASPIASRAEVVRDNQTYQVLGTTREEIRASIDRLAPLDPATAERRDSLTRWELDWRYDARDGVQGCDIAQVWTTLRITTVLPRHGAVSSLPDEMRQEWTRVLQRLTDHE
ncbi:MAG: DUF922 domain-containing protein, partial [Zoogloeaceae bacterium]|nr:DUF922 domain-containing protein [Zoogloeaceae bacterium]